MNTPRILMVLTVANLTLLAFLLLGRYYTRAGLAVAVRYFGWTPRER